MHISRRTLLMIVGGVLFALACNLSRTPPTPTAAPTQPGEVVTSIAPTLFASITPLAGFGGFGGATQAPITNVTTCTPPAGWVQYTVQAGDYLAGLADATGASVQDIVNANCLPDANTLYSGQVLYLPKTPVSG